MNAFPRPRLRRDERSIESSVPYSSSRVHVTPPHSATPGAESDGRTVVELVLWDLDETLLSSHHLRDARHQSTPCELRQLDVFPGTALHEGVAQVMTKTEDVRMGIVTSSPLWYVEQILDHFMPKVSFDVMVTYEDVPEIKPDPRPLELALRRAGVKPWQSIYIGDSIVDYEACASAKVRFLGAGWADEPTFPRGAEILRHPLDLWAILEAA